MFGLQGAFAFSFALLESIETLYSKFGGTQALGPRAGDLSAGTWQHGGTVCSGCVRLTIYGGIQSDSARALTYCHSRGLIIQFPMPW